jgi:hypothetical protein
LAISQTIELAISTPQPRLNETFQITLDINHLRANIFRSLAGKVQLSTDINNTDYGQLTMNVNALKKGKIEIGPLEFTLDKTKYSTNKIAYEVIEPLPNTDNGLWFRKVSLTDSTFCIIIEQRIPASNKRTVTSDNSISFTTEPAYSNIAKFKDTYSIAGLNSITSHSSTNFGSITEDQENQKQFLFAYSVYYFQIIDKKAKIKITKDKFENIPHSFKIEDIIIQ